MNIDTVFNALLYFWVAIFLFDQLIFKYFVLKELKLKHAQIWHEMGCPNVFSSQEFVWSVIGFGSNFDVMTNIKKDNASMQTIKLLVRYRYFAYFDVALLLTIVMLAIVK